MAYKTGNQYPQAAATAGTGTDYGNVSNLLFGGAARLSGNVPNGYIPTVNEIKLIVGGTALATNKATGAPAAGSVNFSPTNWGAAGLTVAQLKAADFGVRFKHDSGFRAIEIKGFDFSLIPDSATITDIKFNYFYSVNNIGGGDATFDTLALSVDVTFNYVATLTASGWNEGLLVADNPNPKPIETELRYSAFDKDRNFLGEYNRVVGDPSLKLNMNQLHSSFSLDLGQNDLTEEEELAQILNESGDNLITEDSANWLASLTTPVAIGEDVVVQRAAEELDAAAPQTAPK